MATSEIQLRQNENLAKFLEFSDPYESKLFKILSAINPQGDNNTWIQNRHFASSGISLFVRKLLNLYTGTSKVEVPAGLCYSSLQSVISCWRTSYIAILFTPLHAIGRPIPPFCFRPPLSDWLSSSKIVYWAVYLHGHANVRIQNRQFAASFGALALPRKYPATLCYSSFQSVTSCQLRSSIAILFIPPITRLDVR